VTRFVVDCETLLRIAAGETKVAAEHKLVAPTLVRSQALAALYEAARQGEISAAEGIERVTRINSLNVRFLGDKVLQRNAWKVADSVDRLLAALADDVSRPELLGESDAIGVTAEEDDPLGAESFASDHAAQADRTIADDGRDLARTYPCGPGGMVSGSHDVREREQRGHQRVVSVDGQDH